MPAADPPDGSRQVAWLVLRAQTGDRQALEELLRLTQRTLRAYAVGMMGDADQASDVMQQALLTIYRKLDGLQEPRAYWAWARRIASRTAMAAIRSRRREWNVHEPITEEVTERAATPAEIRSWVPDLLQRLPSASREVLLLHYGEQLTIEEVATVLDLPAGTVKSRLSYGLRSLRRSAREGSVRTSGA